MSTQKQNQSSPHPAAKKIEENTKISRSVETIGKEIEKGGRKGLEPTRYGDWELNGKCVDF
ncbi:MAG: DUF1674 domain-containing protein [Micavibrio aeruginosavorus]|uniref:DUF1674 domain-containing protein n=1 Tax=Micavibrio aeruginosavorus TaxID=349221 RepID=A0A7T5R3A4_9BACT|nr:MAG: DUF1674 domain-containing protein [Micavibrio aeruginosavorus]